MTRARRHLRANTPVVAWLLAALVVTFVHPLVSQPRWLMVHLLLLGAVTNAIVVWSAHFAEALLRSAPTTTARRRQAIRIVGLNLGVVLVVAGVVSARWALTAVGASAVIAAVGWHGWALLGEARRALPARFDVTVRYYVAAAAMLPVGAVLGVLLARGLAAPLHDRVVVAHAVVNLLGWVGLTVAGTLVTLWPTMLRTRIATGAERAAQQALPVLVVSVATTVLAALLGLQWAAAFGVLGYVGGLGVAGRPMVDAARRRPPASYPTWSVLAGCSWLVGCLLAVVVVVVTAPGWVEVGGGLGALTAPLAVGFAAQVLLGALSYLVPVVLGGGPARVRAATDVLERGGALRITLVNLGLLVSVLPVPSLVRVFSSFLVVGGLAAFLPLLALAVRTSRSKGSTDAPSAGSDGQRKHDGGQRGTRPATGNARASAGPAGMVALGAGAVLIAVAGGVALDPSAVAGERVENAAHGVAPTGETTTVEVEAADMRFTPDRIEVPAGDRLVIVLENTDTEDVHDLVLESGARSGRLAPGESATIDVGVVGTDLEGWCSVVGHRQMGMALTIDVGDTPAAVPAAGADEDPGADARPDSPHRAPHDSGDDAQLGVAPDPSVEPPPDFVAHDASLPPPAKSSTSSEPTTHRLTLRVRDVEREVAPGVTQTLWTYNGTMPGPTLRGEVGDVFDITLVNDGSIGHSLDFHAGALAPDRPMRTIPPGESLRYRFKATHSGAWLYHCASMPMSTHIANGLFGAVVIEPRGLSAVDREYLLVQSELYLGTDGGEADPDKVADEQPDLVAFNGYAGQYDHRPLEARAGERVRVWVVDAGPNRPSAFHVVGALFDTVYAEGAYRLRPDASGDDLDRGGSQVLDLAPAQGGFVELTFPEPGHYPFLSHSMVDAERGASGQFLVRPGR